MADLFGKSPAECYQPKSSAEELQSKLQEFYDGISELRRKCGIANVAIIVKDSIVESGQVYWDGFFGMEVELEMMAAWHFGKAGAERQELVRRAAEHGCRNAIRKPEKQD